ncbi:hypothetical protein [Pseudoduganella lurida]|nr:hypothetical protein [Pseudoduganella lurida]
MTAMAVGTMTAPLAHAAPAGDGASPRTATPDEQSSFFDWYNATHQQTTSLLRPQFTVKKEGGRKGKRLVTAIVDGPAVRAVLPLCRQPRTLFDLDPRAPKAARWTERTPAQTLVWIEHQRQCGAQPDTPILLHAPLAEMDMLMLLQQHPTVLGNARLLMAGNSACAPSRSRGYRLTGLDRAKDGLPVLVFENDIAGEARVSVRRSRNELQPWAVVCAPPR